MTGTDNLLTLYIKHKCVWDFFITTCKMCTQFGKNPILCNKFLSTLQAGRLFSLQCTFVPFYCFPQTKIRYTFQHYQHGPRRLIEERNELGEGPLKNAEAFSAHRRTAECAAHFRTQNVANVRQVGVGFDCSVTT